MKIKSGDIIKSHQWPEPVQIDLLEEIGEYVRLVGSTVHSRDHIDVMLTRDEVNELQVGKLSLDFKAKARHVFLSLEARRYRYAALYDSLFAVSASKVDPLPHQIEAVYGHVLKLPRIRFLIADDPGRRQNDYGGAYHQGVETASSNQPHFDCGTGTSQRPVAKGVEGAV